MLAELCRKYTRLEEKDIKILIDIEKTLQYTADLAGADVFINCLTEDKDKAVVVAEAKPTGGLSVYVGTVLGEMALRQNEPAVFRAFEIAMPVRDLKAITQEYKAVKQDVVPIKNDTGEVIAVLIGEKDISESINTSKKLNELARTTEHLTETLNNATGPVNPSIANLKEGSLAMKEIHHRIKNNLQMVASILNLQARRSTSLELKSALKENINRVLSIAAIHDILTKNSTDEGVRLKDLMEKIRHNITLYAVQGYQNILIVVEGDDLIVDADKAASIALVANELIANAIEHAFIGKNQGRITVSLQAGSLYSTITVTDDGNGFDPLDKKENSLGLDLVMVTVRDKLKGNLRIQSGANGITVFFDFPID